MCVLSFVCVEFSPCLFLISLLYVTTLWCVCVLRIRKISGLQALTKLDVLDLHGNMVRCGNTVRWKHGKVENTMVGTWYSKVGTW